MGTWTTDIAGTGLAKHMPSRSEKAESRLIAKRWKIWHPILLHELRKTTHPPGFMAKKMREWEHDHHEIMTRLLSKATPYYRIRNLGLDDPRQTEEWRIMRLLNPKSAPRRYGGGRKPKRSWSDK